MVIRYFDKDGKEHRLNLKSGQPVFIASEIGNTGEYVEFRMEEHKGFNQTVGTFTTTGSFDVCAASDKGISIIPEGHNQLILGPSC